MKRKRGPRMACSRRRKSPLEDDAGAAEVDAVAVAKPVMPKPTSVDRDSLPPADVNDHELRIGQAPDHGVEGLQALVCNREIIVGVPADAHKLAADLITWRRCIPVNTQPSA